MFLSKSYLYQKKLDEKIDLKKLIDEQLEERHGIRRY